MNYKVRVAVFKGGKHINTYPSIKEAADALGLYSVLISRALTSGLNYARGYTFKRFGPKRRKIAGSLIEVWQKGVLHKICSVRQAAAYTGVSDTSIRHCLPDVGKVKN